MYEQVSPFGAFFRKKRDLLKVGIWPLCVKISMYPANLVRMEKGIQEPRLDIALRMVNGLGLSFASFFAELRDFAHLPLPQREALPVTIPQDKLPSVSSSCGQVYGELLRYVRVQSGQSQKNLAEAVGIHLRNLTKIENGGQIPRVMTAMRLVCATGCNIADFFKEFEKRYQLEIIG